MNSRVGIFGVSGMAREAGDIAWACGLEPFYVALNNTEKAAWQGEEDVILEDDVATYSASSFVVGIGDNEIRKKLAVKFNGLLKFTNLIHPSATFGREQRKAIESARGVIIAAGVRFTSSIQVGDFVLFNQNATIAHDCQIDCFSHVAPGANISGNVHLEEGCWVGAGAVINQGNGRQKIVVGAKTVVGSGAVVTRNCERGSVYAGIPAKRVK